MQEKILVLDFGGQYNQLIARRVRDQHVYAELKPYNKITVEEIAAEGYKGIIFTGGPNSVYDPASPHYDKALLEAGIPILGICYGHQLLAWMAEGKIGSAGNFSEYGKVTVKHSGGVLFEGVPEESTFWMSHTDSVMELPEGFTGVASTGMCKVAAMEDPARKLFGVQFHPEVQHSEYGKQVLHNFLFKVCGCSGDWHMDDFCKRSVQQIREKVGDGKVLLALSGGVDSSVCAALLAEAIGPQLTCVFVDHGMMRKNEPEEVRKAFENWDINFVGIDASTRFLKALEGVTEPEAKRKTIGEEFIRVFEEEGKKIGSVDYLAQGTIYADVIESGAGDAATIKSHHNVGGLPKDSLFKKDHIIEPLSLLFKDEVRAVGEGLGIPHDMVWRQPFPGPGLAVRVIGDITREKLDLLRACDAIYLEELKNAGLSEAIWQSFAVLTGVRTVGCMGDDRTYGYCVGLRAVTSDDAMTVEAAEIPYPVLKKCVSRIIGEVPGVNRVVYDITGKPPGTIEWE